MIELLNIDCMEYMSGLPDKAFDLAIVDPIYGHDITGGHSGENGWRSKEHWAKASEGWNTIKTGKDYFLELFRVTKNAICWGGNYFTEYLPSSEGWIVWDKGQRDFSLADAELAWTSFEKATRVFNLSRPVSNFTENRIHPTQKPTKLYKWILKNYAKEGDRILDTHLGSGSSAIAAHEMGFSFVGCEIDHDYYNAAVKRYNEAIKQQSLFSYEK